MLSVEESQLWSRTYQWLVEVNGEDVAGGNGTLKRETRSRVDDDDHDDNSIGCSSEEVEWQGHVVENLSPADQQEYWAREQQWLGEILQRLDLDDGWWEAAARPSLQVEMSMGGCSGWIE